MSAHARFRTYIISLSLRKFSMYKNVTLSPFCYCFCLNLLNSNVSNGWSRPSNLFSWASFYMYIKKLRGKKLPTLPPRIKQRVEEQRGIVLTYTLCRTYSSDCFFRCIYNSCSKSTTFFFNCVWTEVHVAAVPAWTAGFHLFCGIVDGRTHGSRPSAVAETTLT